MDIFAEHLTTDLIVDQQQKGMGTGTHLEGSGQGSIGVVQPPRSNLPPGFSKGVLDNARGIHWGAASNFVKASRSTLEVLANTKTPQTIRSSINRGSPNGAGRT